LALIWLTLGYFGVFDLGLGRAVAQKLASIGDSDAVATGRVFWTSSLLNAGFGIFGGLLMWPVCQFALPHFTSSEVSSEIGFALPWLMLGVPLVTLSSGFGGALQGRSRFLELNPDLDNKLRADTNSAALCCIRRRPESRSSRPVGNIRPTCCALFCCSGDVKLISYQARPSFLSLTGGSFGSLVDGLRSPRS
jgi:hypothetical protein